MSSYFSKIGDRFQIDELVSIIIREANDPKLDVEAVQRIVGRLDSMDLDGFDGFVTVSPEIDYNQIRTIVEDEFLIECEGNSCRYSYLGDNTIVGPLHRMIVDHRNFASDAVTQDHLAAMILENARIIGVPLTETQALRIAEVVAVEDGRTDGLITAHYSHVSSRENVTRLIKDKLPELDADRIGHAASVAMDPRTHFAARRQKSDVIDRADQPAVTNEQINKSGPLMASTVPIAEVVAEIGAALPIIEAYLANSHLILRSTNNHAGDYVAAVDGARLTIAYLRDTRRVFASLGTNLADSEGAVRQSLLTLTRSTSLAESVQILRTNMATYVERIGNNTAHEVGRSLMTNIRGGVANVIREVNARFVSNNMQIVRTLGSYGQQIVGGARTVSTTARQVTPGILRVGDVWTSAVRTGSVQNLIQTAHSGGPYTKWIIGAAILTAAGITTYLLLSDEEEG